MRRSRFKSRLRLLRTLIVNMLVGLGVAWVFRRATPACKKLLLLPLQCELLRLPYRPVVVP